MTIGRGVLRVLLATVAVGGVVVTYGATRNTIGAMPEIPNCNCNTWQECDSQGGYKCVNEKDLCQKVLGCDQTCYGYCEKKDPDPGGGQPK